MCKRMVGLEIECMYEKLNDTMNSSEVWDCGRLFKRLGHAVKIEMEDD